MKDFQLYALAVAADDLYQAELERVYGKAMVSQKRYAEHTDIVLIRLRNAKIAADLKWVEEMTK